MSLKTVSENNAIFCKLRFKRVELPVDISALNEVIGRMDSAVILGGNKSKREAGRFSCWAAEPRELFEFRQGQDNIFEKLEKVLNKYRLEEAGTDQLPSGVFCGGWAGYFSYELGRHIERFSGSSIDDIEMPLIRLGFYDRVICFDHVDGVFWLIALQLADELEDKLGQLEEILTRAKDTEVTRPRAGEIEKIDISSMWCNMDKDYYLAAVEKIKRYIYDGDVYQVNFSQRFECDFAAEPIDLFAWQNFYNPSPYAAYIKAENFDIVSASPEMFITIRDGIISTRPIKGTRARFSETEDGKTKNKQNYHELLNCEKEQAELNMIIDLERNDLARICKPGTRKVIQGRTIEKYPTVFHAAATVAGQLTENTTFSQVTKAMFPGGSITGAPKISAMEIIEELEPTARSVYTGSIGFIGLDGAVCLNIAIRTIIIKAGKAYAQVGGGIVADSDAQAEWAETITKARALLAGISESLKIKKRKI